METIVIVRDVVGAVPYWAADESLSKVKARFKRLSGKFPGKRAIIDVFTGKSEDIEKISVNDLGDISYPKGICKVNIAY